MVLPAIVRRMEETAPPALNGNFAGSLAGRIGIVPAERIVFPVTGLLFAVLVTLVGGDHHAHPHAVDGPDGFHHVNGTHHINGIGFGRDVVTKADEGLRSKMENHFRTVFREDFLHPPDVPDVRTEIRPDLLSDTGKDIIVSLRSRVQCHANHFRTQLAKPDGKPTSFEAGMAGDQHALAGVKTVKGIFHRLQNSLIQSAIYCNFSRVIPG